MKISKEQYNAQNERLFYCDLLRIILVVLVVVGHATYYTIQTAYGGIDYSFMMKEEGIADSTFHELASVLTGWIYSFHMPVFVSMSGVLFGIQMKKGRYENFKELLIEKIKRLVVPFLVVWLFWNVPIKLVSGYYTGISVTDILLQMFFFGVSISLVSTGFIF